MPTGARGIYRYGAGWRAVVSRGRGLTPFKQTFPLHTPMSVMVAWRADQQAHLRITRKQRANQGTFEGDARRYLRAVQTMPTYAQRVADITRWIALFGTRPRDAIRPIDIREARDRWAIAPRSAHDPRPVGPGTINKRLRALSNLWTVLDGKRAPNPVRDVDEIREPDPVARDLDYPTIERIIAHMPDVGRPVHGQTRPRGSQTKARVRVLAYSGLPPAQLVHLTSADVDLERGLIRLPRRQKGAGVPGGVLPLMPAAVDAFREFARLKCWGPFSRSSLYKSFTLAARRAGVTAPVRPYDLRHSFGTVVFDLTDDLDLAKALMRHGNRQTTERYVMRAMQRALEQKGARLGQTFPAAPAAAGPVLPAQRAGVPWSPGQCWRASCRVPITAQAKYRHCAACLARRRHRTRTTF
ncbi:MAG: tyrosine-type recombinase/integrase [Acidobacteria bacterium]|nr:tyrosine-type recombinase/integrase [Acidobacteriota bacterium]